MALRADVDDRGFTATLTKAAGLGSHDYRTAFRRIGREWLKQVDEGFQFERDPYGNPWPPLAAATVYLKIKAGASHPEAILQETGEFRDSFTAEINRRGLTIVTSRVFDDGNTPEIHQFGGVSEKFGSAIPPRPFLPLEGIPEFWQFIAVKHLGDETDRYFA